MGIDCLTMFLIIGVDKIGYQNWLYNNSYYRSLPAPITEKFVKQSVTIVA